MALRTAARNLDVRPAFFMGFHYVRTSLVALAVVLALPAAGTAQARLLVDARGEFDAPVFNVRVTVQHEKGGAVAGECRTDLSGKCLITVASAQRYIVKASLANHFSPGGPREIQPPAGDSPLSITIVPVPPPMPERDPNASVVEGAIVGTVLSLNGEPLAGVGVQALSDGRYQGRMDVSREDGSFRIVVIPGTYTVRSETTTTGRKPGYVFEASAYGAPVVVTEGQASGPVVLYPASFKLPRVNVTVVTPGGLPAAGADVIDWSQWSSFTDATITYNGARKAGTDGTVVIPSALPGKLVLTATATVGDEQLAGMEIVDVGNAPLDVFMRLGPAAQVTGRVEFVGRSRPLHGGDGLRVLPDPGWARHGMLSTDTNGIVGADGEFVLKGLAGERCLVLRGIPPEWRLAEVTQYGQPVEHHRFSFLQGQTVTGVVFHVEPTTDYVPPTPPCPLTNPR
jgi:hypothetical protein